MSRFDPGFLDDDGNPITEEYFQRQAEKRELRDKAHASMTPEERREWERRYATDTAHVNKSNVDKPQQVAPNDAKASRTNGQASRPRERRAQRSSSKASSPSGSDDDLDDSGPGGAGLLVRRRHTESHWRHPNRTRCQGWRR